MTNTTFTAKDAIAKADAFHAEQAKIRFNKAQTWVNNFAIPAIIRASEQGEYSVSGIHTFHNDFAIIKDILGELGFSATLKNFYVYISWTNDQA